MPETILLGAIGAAVLEVFVLVIKSFPTVAQRLYKDKLELEKEEREERRRERAEMIEIVRNNTTAMVKVTDAVELLNSVVTTLGRDVAHIYTYLKIQREEVNGTVK